MMLGLLAFAFAAAPDPTFAITGNLGFPYMAHVDARYWWSPTWSVVAGGGVGYDFWIGVVNVGVRAQPAWVRHDFSDRVSLRGGLGLGYSALIDQRLPMVLTLEPDVSLHVLGEEGHGLLIGTRVGFGLTTELGSNAALRVEPALNLGLIEVGYVF